MTTDKPRPIQTVRVGTIQAAIWANTGTHGPIYNVTFERGYRDNDGNWKNTASFGRDDLLVLAKVANEAHSFVCQRQSEERSSADHASQAAGEANQNGSASSQVVRRRVR